MIGLFEITEVQFTLVPEPSELMTNDKPTIEEPSAQDPILLQSSGWVNSGLELNEWNTLIL